MSRLTIQMPAGLADCGRGSCESDGASETARPCRPHDERGDGVDEAARAFESWVACWAGA